MLGPLELLLRRGVRRRSPNGKGLRHNAIPPDESVRHRSFTLKRVHCQFSLRHGRAPQPGPQLDHPPWLGFFLQRQLISSVLKPNEPYASNSKISRGLQNGIPDEETSM